jgi:hypothetical protein
MLLSLKPCYPELLMKKKAEMNVEKKEGIELAKTSGAPPTEVGG